MDWSRGTEVGFGRKKITYMDKGYFEELRLVSFVGTVLIIKNRCKEKELSLLTVG